MDIRQDLLENYNIKELQLLARYYHLPTKLSLDELIDAIAKANLGRQKANMLPHAMPIHESLVRGMSFDDAVSLCNTDKSFAAACQQPLIWKTWAEAHPDERDSALSKAMKNNKLNIVKGLLAGGANIDMDTLRYYVLDNDDYLEMAKLLLTDPNWDRSNVFNWLAWPREENTENVIKLLLADPYGDPAADNNSAIRWASNFGNVEMVKLLLADPRVDPADNNNDAIVWASEAGHAEIVKLLLADPRVNPAAQNNKALRGGNSEVAKLLKADPRVQQSLRN